MWKNDNYVDILLERNYFHRGCDSKTIFAVEEKQFYHGWNLWEGWFEYGWIYIKDREAIVVYEFMWRIVYPT